MASTYRRKKGKDTWHFCSNCSNWPTSDYDSKTEKPTRGGFCNECLRKKANNDLQLNSAGSELDTTRKVKLAWRPAKYSTRKLRR